MASDNFSLLQEFGKVQGAKRAGPKRQALLGGSRGMSLLWWNNLSHVPAITLSLWMKTGNPGDLFFFSLLEISIFLVSIDQFFCLAAVLANWIHF